MGILEEKKIPGGVKMEKYLVNHWKNYIYIILLNVSKGYWYYNQFEYPIKKKEKWLKIDEKIINKYKINISKDQRYRNKKKGKANYLFYRYENQAILLRTEGERILEDDEPWSKLQGSNSIKIKVNNTEFEIKNINEKFSVKLSKNTFREIKAEIKLKLEKKLVNQGIFIIEKIGNLPNYAFLKNQKEEIVKFFIQQYKIHMGNPGVQLKKKLKDIISKQVPLRKLPLFIKE